MFYLLVTESPTQTDLNSEDIYYILLSHASDMSCIIIFRSQVQDGFLRPNVGVQHLFCDSFSSA